MSSLITLEKAYIFRIVHIDNIEWILKNGVHCRNSSLYDPNYVEIGNPDLIGKRVARDVPGSYGGTLSDYVPFYFTPYSPMLLNIKTGYNGIKMRPMSDIVILVASLRNLANEGVKFVFTNGHAFLNATKFSSDLSNLEHWIPWEQLRARDFKRDPENPEKFERYQAEALVYRSLPVSSLIGMLCYDTATKEKVDKMANSLGVGIDTAAMPGWYF